MDVLLIAIIYIILLSFGYGGISAAIWIPTRKRERERLVKELPLSEGKTMIDLGCGDGVVLFTAADKVPGLRAVGYEVAFLPVFWAKARKIFGGAKYRNVNIRIRDFFTQNLAEADVVFAFLLPKAYNRLVKKFGRELKDDCIVVIEAWNIPGLEPRRVIKEPEALPLYFYEGRQFRQVQ